MIPMALSSRFLAAALAVALGAGGCAKARARTRPEPLPLAATPLAGGAALAPAPEGAPVSAWLAEPQPVEPPVTDRPPAVPARRPAPPPSMPPPPEPPRRLGTPETADASETTRRVRASLERARQSLAKVDPARLRGDARVQYQTARQLIEQAEEALETRNFVYAVRLADKAETLARRLAGGA